MISKKLTLRMAIERNKLQEFIMEHSDNDQAEEQKFKSFISFMLQNSKVGQKSSFQDKNEN